MKQIFLTLSTLFAVLAYGQFDFALNSDGIRSAWYNPASAGTYNTFTAQVQANRIKIFEGVFTNVINAEASVKCLSFGKKEGAKLKGLGTVGIQFNLNDQDILRSQAAKLVLNSQFQIKNTYLSIGISPGLQVLSLTDDWVFPTEPEVVNETEGSIDAGLQWFGKNFSVGIATQRINEPSFTDLNFSTKRVLYAHAEYVFAIGENWNIRPRVAGRTADGFNTLEAMIFTNYENLPLTVGVGLRNRESFIAGLYGRYSSFSLGYFTNIETSSLFGNRFGHEVRLSYALPDKNLNSVFDGDRGILSF